MSSIIKYLSHPQVFMPYILFIIIGDNSYKKILNHNTQHKDPVQVEDCNSLDDSNYLWATQDIDSKEFYEKIKSNRIVKPSTHLIL
jgi:hypothetical protein